jgi:hypothetical protein
MQDTTWGLGSPVTRDRDLVKSARDTVDYINDRKKNAGKKNAGHDEPAITNSSIDR